MHCDVTVHIVGIFQPFPLTTQKLTVLALPLPLNFGLSEVEELLSGDR